MHCLHYTDGCCEPVGWYHSHIQAGATVQRSPTATTTSQVGYSRNSDSGNYNQPATTVTVNYGSMSSMVVQVKRHLWFCLWTSYKIFPWPCFTTADFRWWICDFSCSVITNEPFNQGCLNCPKAIHQRLWHRRESSGVFMGINRAVILHKNLPPLL